MRARSSAETGGSGWPAVSLSAAHGAAFVVAYCSGTVGNILDAADWTSKQFGFGLYARPMNLQGQKFPLIGYWVD